MASPGSIFNLSNLRTKEKHFPETTTESRNANKRPAFLRLDSTGENTEDIQDLSPEAEPYRNTRPFHSHIHAHNTFLPYQQATPCRSSSNFMENFQNFLPMRLVKHRNSEFDSSSKFTTFSGEMNSNINCKSANSELEYLVHKFGGNQSGMQGNMAGNDENIKAQFPRNCGTGMAMNNQSESKYAKVTGEHCKGSWSFFTPPQSTSPFRNQQCYVRKTQRSFPAYYQHLNSAFHPYFTQHPTSAFVPLHSFTHFQAQGLPLFAHPPNHSRQPHNTIVYPVSTCPNNSFQNQQNPYNMRVYRLIDKQNMTRNCVYDRSHEVSRKKHVQSHPKKCQTKPQMDSLKSGSCTPFGKEMVGTVRVLKRNCPPLQVEQIKQNNSESKTSQKCDEENPVQHEAPVNNPHEDCHSDALKDIKDLATSVERTSIEEINPTPQISLCTPKEEESVVKCKSAHSSDNTQSSQRHSSIDFLLSNLTKNLEVSSDSDFVDADWDTLDDEAEHDDSWEEDFVDFVDPYNPLHGWRCREKQNKVDSTLDANAINEYSFECKSKESYSGLDSGTESGSENSDSNSVDSDEAYDINDENNPCLSNQRTTEESKENKQLNEESSLEDPCGIQIEKNEMVKNEEKELNAPLRHPSLNFILGACSSDDEDEESDDWDSWDDSDEDNDENDPSVKSVQEQLWKSFLSSNDQFNPLRSWQCKEGSKLQNSAPQHPIPVHSQVVFRTASVTITHRVLHCDSNTPVSVSVPLQPDGRLQRSPTIEQKEFLPTKIETRTKRCKLDSCFRTTDDKSSKPSKKVSFSTNAILIICPEPVHLSEDIRSTRKGPWIEMARDRCHFQRRIRDVEIAIAPHLHQNHRQKIYAERFNSQAL